MKANRSRKSSGAPEEKKEAHKGLNKSNSNSKELINSKIFKPQLKTNSVDSLDNSSIQLLNEDVTQSEPDLILQMREKQAINQPKPK